MIDKKTEEIERRGKVTQNRDSKGRFVSNKKKPAGTSFKVEYSYEDVSEVTIKITAPLAYKDKELKVTADIPYLD